MKTPPIFRPLLLGAAILTAAGVFPVRAAAQDMGSDVIIALTELQPLPDHEAAVLHTAKTVRAASLPDPDCLYYFVTQKHDDPATLELFEVFRSPAAFEAHLRAPGTLAFLASVKENVVGSQPRTTLLKPLPEPVSGGGPAPSGLTRK